MWLVAMTCGSVGAIVAASAGPTAFTGGLRTPARCLRSLTELDSGISLIRAGAGDALPNLLLYLPAGFLLTILTRRAGGTFVSLVVLSAAIEVGQGLIGRSCTSADWMTNSLGAALGAGAGAVLLLVLPVGASGAGGGSASSGDTVPVGRGAS